MDNLGADEFLDYLHSSRQMTACRPTEYKQFVLMSCSTHRLNVVITCSGHSDILQITLSHKSIWFYGITNRCNCTQWILFLCLVHSTCFGWHTRPSSGVQSSTVSTANGTIIGWRRPTYDCTIGCRYSGILYSWSCACMPPETCRVN